MSHVTHLEASIDGTRLQSRTIQTVHEGRPLLVRYDLEAVRRSVAKEDLVRRAPSLWRYRELLPVEDPAHVTSLGEGMTPLLDCPRLAADFGVARLLVKDESQLPTSRASRSRPRATPAARSRPTRRARGSRASSSCPRTRPS
jgi:threonine synthase